MEITKSDYQSWRHHPVSKIILKFLGDKRAFLQQHAIDQWISGSLSLQADQTLRGQIIELFEMENLEFEAVEIFYNQGEDSEA